MLTRGDGRDVNHVQGGLGIAGVAGELGHGLAGVGVDVLLDGVCHREVALKHVLRVGDAVLLDGEARGQLDGLAAHGAGNLELVVAERRRGGLEAGAHVDRGVQADGDGDGHVLAELLVLVEEGAEVTGAGRDPHAEGRLVLDAEAVDGDVGRAVLGIGTHGEAHGDVGAGVLGGVGGRGDELAQVEARVGRLVDDLLAVDVLAVGDHDGRNGLVELLAHLDAEVLLVHADELRDALAAREHADDDLGVVKALDVVEQHRGAFLGGTGDRSAGADEAVDTRHLGVGVDLGSGLEELAGLGLEIVESRAKIMNLCHRYPPTIGSRGLSPELRVLRQS